MIDSAYTKMERGRNEVWNSGKKINKNCQINDEFNVEWINLDRLATQQRVTSSPTKSNRLIIIIIHSDSIGDEPQYV